MTTDAEAEVVKDLQDRQLDARTPPFQAKGGG